MIGYLICTLKLSRFPRYGVVVEALQPRVVEVMRNSSRQVRVVLKAEVVATSKRFNFVRGDSHSVLVFTIVGVAYHRLELLRDQVDVATDEAEHFGVIEIHWVRRLISLGMAGKCYSQAMDDVPTDLRSRVC